MSYGMIVICTKLKDDYKYLTLVEFLIRRLYERWDVDLIGYN